MLLKISTFKFISTWSLRKSFQEHASGPGRLHLTCYNQMCTSILPGLQRKHWPAHSTDCGMQYDTVYSVLLTEMRENCDWKMITNNSSFFPLKSFLRGKVSIHEEDIHKHTQHPYWTEDLFESLNTRRDHVNHVTPSITNQSQTKTVICTHTPTPHKFLSQSSSEQENHGLILLQIKILHQHSHTLHSS